MPNNRSGDSPNTRSAGGARPTTVGAPPPAGRHGSYAVDSSVNHTHSAASVDLTDDQLDCAICGELRARAEPVRHGVDVVLESGNTEIDELCGHGRAVQDERRPDCLEVVYEVPSPPDSSVSRFATGRQGDDSSGQFARYQQEIDRLVCEVPVPVSMASPEPFIAHVRSIRHSGHRYPTVGDWQFQQAAVGCVHIAVQVSATADWRHAALIAVHELVEAILCRHRGISQDEVDSFDLAHPELADPGASDNAPYHDEHMSAEFIERQLAGLLNVDWTDYNAALDALDE